MLDENFIDETSHPWDYIRKEIEERGWSQKYFAGLMGINKSEVNKLIKGKINLTPRLAVCVATAFWTSVEVWLNLQNMYDMRIIHEDKKMKERVNQIKARMYAISLTSIGGSKRRELEVA